MLIHHRLLVHSFAQSRRSFTQTRQLIDLQQVYQLLKDESFCNLTSDEQTAFLSSLHSASSVSYSEKMNPKGIFANNELDLQQIKVYGFDFGEERCSSLSLIHRGEMEIFRLHFGTL